MCDTMIKFVWVLPHQVGDYDTAIESKWVKLSSLDRSVHMCVTGTIIEIPIENLG